MNTLESRFTSKARPGSGPGNNPDNVSINKTAAWKDNFWDVEEKIKLENKE